MITISQQAASGQELTWSNLGADGMLGSLYERAERDLREVLADKGIVYDPKRAMVVVRVEYLYTKEETA